MERLLNVKWLSVAVLALLAANANAAFVIEDGNGVINWSNVCGVLIVYSQDATQGNPSPSIQMDVPAGDWNSVVGAWNPSGGFGYPPGLDWSSYTQLDVDLKFSAPAIAFRWNNNDGSWSPLGSGNWVQISPLNANWNHYSIDITGLQRSNVAALWLYTASPAAPFTLLMDNLQLGSEVPEPATMALLALGGAGLLLRRKR